MPPFEVFRFAFLLNVFLFEVTYSLLSSEALSPITIDDEFLYGITAVGDGSLLLCALGWYFSKGFLIMPAW
eukprot:CAMPEP_0168334698 /NCGR_PEP_ID=MMETSP0213-20121227/10440_1 /TAXON_ID=151035 /ORGANISM="Euplotes harpa, Strain FSP1.4" /LENGTH=70 /DNA_ID=CAMNT_0008339427 /DNA_START=65 /DNA_END=274 /DNA_ORIENTATION=-